MTEVEVVKQASWGTTRDNLVLGSAGAGIDGSHILTPMPYLISTGKVTQNNQPLPMVILARLNLDAQAISVGAAYSDLQAGLDASVLKEAFAKKKAEGAAAKVAMTLGHHTKRRTFLTGSAAVATTSILAAVLPIRPAGAQQAGRTPIRRPIPKSGEMIPAIGLGTFETFDILPGEPRDHVRDVIRLFHENGGRVIDTSPLYGMAEVCVGDFVMDEPTCPER